MRHNIFNQNDIPVEETTDVSRAPRKSKKGHPCSYTVTCLCICSHSHTIDEEWHDKLDIMTPHEHCPVHS